VSKLVGKPPVYIGEFARQILINKRG